MKKVRIAMQRAQENSLSKTDHSINGMINYMNNIHINTINAFISFQVSKSGVKT